MRNINIFIIVRGSTSELSFPIPEDFGEIQNMWATFEQNKEEVFTLELSDFTLEDNVLSYRLPQEKTLLFDEGICEMQVKFLLSDGSAPMTYPFDIIYIARAAKSEVIGGRTE